MALIKIHANIKLMVQLEETKNLDYLHGTKVDVPHLVTSLNQPPNFEWYVVRRGSENEYQKDMCFKRAKSMKPL